MKKILIVEDDEKLRNELEIFLNNNGYKAQTLCKYILHPLLVNLCPVIIGLDLFLKFYL